jgi:general secretion pathway protein F
MGAFQYQALNRKGNSSKGVIEADSERHARQLLRDRGLIPTSVHTLKKSQVSKHRDRISTQDLALLTRQLATLLAAGIPVEESLKGVSEQTEKPKTQRLLIGVRSKVLEGFSLAQAVGEYPQVFPELYRATVAAGEQTGHLDMVLEKLADYTENQQQIRQKIQQALIYPLLMIIVSTTIISFLLAYVVPKIIEVFTSSGQSLPEMTQVLLIFSGFIKHYGLYSLILLVVLILGFQKSLEKTNVKFGWHRLLLKIPIISPLIQSINVARYVHTFGILFAAGVSVLETMNVSAKLITNLVMQSAFNMATSEVKEGRSISQALKDTGYLKPMATHLIASGEKSGHISSMMERAAAHLDNEVRRFFDTALTLLEPLVILFMGAVVLFIVIATLVPIFSMEQLVS